MGYPSEVQVNDLVSCFRDWFMSRNNPLLDRIFEILRAHDESAADSALSLFNLRLSEALVLDVLSYEQKDTLSCLKFFDWAGRRPNYMKRRYVHKVRFYNTLVIGYAVAVKSEVALELFGRMRFQDVDLDAFANHVLLNSLVEEGYFDVVEMVAKQIRVRAIQNEDNQFEKSALLIEEFHKMNLVSMEYAYSMWIRDHVKAGKLDGALEFLKDKQSVEGYVPDVFRYNSLICRLLMENRLIEVCDLLMEIRGREYCLMMLQ
ncbi:unnamed protein product [Fraxinus pennsylvanica]|uniref:Pentatricopeptide repeat-containing protein n=1 Tax=Fraxinus pennsylvanica TaxID=56036 RepID=A0AAD2ACT2_9LAMI|nr:unnamed protein product [Fraxinus pennsylvanica]